MSTTFVYGKPTLQALKEACQVFTYQQVMYEIVGICLLIGCCFRRIWCN